MNKIELSGTIVGEIDAQSDADGTERASAFLQFHKANGRAILFCFGERARLLAQFKSGDQVRIRGRLMIHRLNGKAAILVDEVHYLDVRHETAETDFWNAARRFQGNARVVDTRWAK